MTKIAEQPFGQTLLWIVALGLLAYGLWRIGEGIWGRREETDDKKRTVKRLESVASGLVNIALGLMAARIAVGSSAAAAVISPAACWTRKEARRSCWASAWCSSVWASRSPGAA